MLFADLDFELVHTHNDIALFLFLNLIVYLYNPGFYHICIWVMPHQK